MAKQDEVMTELKLGLPFAPPSMKSRTTNKRVFSEINDEDIGSSSTITTNYCRKIQKKAQVVGWPPICSYRKKNLTNVHEKYVKISMDGVPYLRKIDINVYKGFSDLVIAFEKLFDCLGRIDKQDLAESSEFIPIYADKEGDWMLVGDVPWTMFIESCKRLRIMRKSDGKSFGLSS